MARHKVSGDAISLRRLNRSTLRRQLLLDRADMPAPDAVARLVGLQAQAARPPYVGLWTRLRRFDRDAFHSAIAERDIVKATFVRATLHVLTADDYLAFRATLQPVLTNALQAILTQRNAHVDIEN